MLNWPELGGDADKGRFWTYFDSAGFDMPQVALEKSGWQIEPTVKRDLLARIPDAGPRLDEFIEDRIYRGVTTGFNRAFELTDAEARQMLSEGSDYSEIIFPILSGDDFERWHTPPSGKHLLFTRRGIDISRFPAAERHLARFREALEPMPASWSPCRPDEKWPGRKAGPYSWYEIQDNTAYWGKFLTPKIITTKISSRPTFSVDKSGSILGNTAYLMPGGISNSALVILLNSSVSAFYCRQIFLGKQGGFYEVQPEGLSAFPIPAEVRGSILNHLDFSEGALNPALEQLLNGLVDEL